MAAVLDTTARERWEREIAAAPQREQPPTTVSNVPIEPLYTPESLIDFDPETDLGYPGQYPFTRGVHASMYRSRLWTMRQFAGFGTPRQTNERFKFLLAKGQTGLSTAFDLPSLMGLDSDDPRAVGEVGRVVELPVEPQEILTGARVRVARVRLADGQGLAVPRANVEWIEE